MRATRTRRILQAAPAVVVLVAAALGTFLYVSWRVDRDDEAPADDAVEFDTFEVVVRSVARSVDIEAAVVYDTPVTISAPSTGTVLHIVDAGAEPDSGDVLARIDDSAIVWLDGDLPAWRPLGVGDEGEDVEQLESALVALGFDPDGEVTVDEDYTDATRRLVERWQADVGVDVTGRIEMGEVVFATGWTRVAATAVDVGDRVEPGDPLLTIGTAERVVEFDAEPDDAVALLIGDEVEVTLPDGSTTVAVVRTIDEAADVWSVEASVEANDLPERDLLEVDVEWSVTVATEVPTVPSSALLRLDDGSYVVDVVTDDGSVDRRTVSVGASSTTRVEIVAGLAVGDRVVVL